MNTRLLIKLQVSYQQSESESESESVSESESESIVRVPSSEFCVPNYPYNPFSS